MPKLIKNEAIIDDQWTLLEEVDSVESVSENTIVPVAFWLENKDNLPANTGVWFASDEEPEIISDLVNNLPLIAIHFPKFADGRGYSIARLLRERYGYQGEIRAFGDVLQDQLFYMKRCGFDAFVIRADRDMEKALQSLNDFSVVYQTGADDRPPVFRVR
ncbi:MAG: DUF934 domain-containing protein [Pseudomonadales bacterium]|nr:DUF934 domain-containing protein [Pseudomonadales bacterium]